MNTKQILIALGVTVVGVILAGFVMSKLGINTYEEYSAFDEAKTQNYRELKIAA